MLIAQPGRGGIIFLLLLWLPWSARVVVWRQVEENLCWQGAGKQRWLVHQGNGAMHGCWDVPGQIPKLGGEGTTPPSNSPGNVPSGCSLGMEGGRTDDPLRPPAWPPTSRPWADVSAIQLVGYQSTREEIWDHYHQVYKIRRLLGSLPCGLEGMPSNKGCGVLLEKLPVTERGQTAEGMWGAKACWLPPIPRQGSTNDKMGYFGSKGAGRG